MPERIVSGVIVYVLREFAAERKVLFLKRSGGQHLDAWWPVAGTPEKGETPLQTALRELHEETSLTPQHLYTFGMEIPHADATKALATFVAMADQQSPVVLNYEHSDFRWLTGDEAVQQVPDHSRKYLGHLRDKFINSQPDPGLLI